MLASHETRNDTRITHRILLLAAPVLLSLAGCMHRAQPLVAVPEGRFRIEAAAHAAPPDNAFALPLDAIDRTGIERFLIAGGDRMNTRDAIDPAGARDIKGLLQLLSDRKWVYEDLLDRHTFDPFFDKKCQTGGLVDARMPSTPTSPPIVCASGKYYWVFYTRGHDLTSLMVFKASIVKPVSPRKN